MIALMKLSAMNSRTLACLLLPLLLASPAFPGLGRSAGAQSLTSPPVLTRSALKQDPAVGSFFDLTLRAHRYDHCVLFFSLAESEQEVPLPASLGGSVTLGLGSVTIFASTADGRIKFNDEGEWTYQLSVPENLLSFVHRLRIDFKIHMQAVSFRRDGPALKPYVSDVLMLPLSEPFETTRLGSALNLLRAKSRLGRSGLPTVPNRLATATPIRRRDVFGNRVFRSRRLP